MSGLSRLAGRIALVTGAGQGIGEGIARRLAAEGAAIAVTDIDPARADRVAAEISAEGGSAKAITLDVASLDAVRTARETVARSHGGLDILVNNAAITDLTGFEALTLDHYRRIIAVNLEGALSVSMGFVDLLRASGRGRVVNIASIQGVRGAPGATAYQVAKGGIVQLTRSMACDLAGDGILVNAVAPGFIDTPMCAMPDGSHEHDAPWFQDIYLKYGRIPLRRAGTPIDVAAAASFFCGDDCAYVTGQILLVDGGLSAPF